MTDTSRLPRPHTPAPGPAPAPRTREDDRDRIAPYAGRVLSAHQQQRLARLARITGFATVYNGDDDPRTRLFARLDHVERAAVVASKLQQIDSAVDPDAVLRLALLHDLNRWPFAHNSERDRFDQVANLNAFFAADEDVTDADIVDLEGIKRKDTGPISDQARLVLLADAITGVIEDPLLAVIGLNVHPRLIPASVDTLMGYSLGTGERYLTCKDNAAAFHGSTPPPMRHFHAHFHHFFFDLVDDFLDEHCEHDLWGAYARTLSITRQVKKSFIEPAIFPLNNGLASHGGWLWSQVMPWYLAHATDAADRHLALDEPEFVAEVTAADDAPFSAEQFQPDLDVITRTRPDLVFVR